MCRSIRGREQDVADCVGDRREATPASVTANTRLREQQGHVWNQAQATVTSALCYCRGVGRSRRGNAGVGPAASCCDRMRHVGYTLVHLGRRARC